MHTKLIYTSNQSCTKYHIETQTLKPYYDHPKHYDCFSQIFQKVSLLFDGDDGGYFWPEPCIFDRRDRLLWVSVYMHVQHEAAEGRAELVRQRLVWHAPEKSVNS